MTANFAPPQYKQAKTPEQITFENLLKTCPYLLTIPKDGFVELVTKSGAAPSVTIGHKGNDIYEIIGNYQGRTQIVTFEVDRQKKGVEALIFQEKGAKTQIEDEAGRKFDALVRNLARQGYQQKGVVRGQGIA